VILIGLGGNLPSAPFGRPRATCGAALEILEAHGIAVQACSRWFESAPVPMSDQPWFVNGVAAVETSLDAPALVAEVLEIEAELGRRRTVPNAARTIDIDLIAYHDLVLDNAGPGSVTIPHPRMHERAFVLRPLADIAPDWRHPVSGAALADLLRALPADQICRPMPDAAGLYGTEWMGEAAFTLAQAT